MNFIKMDSLKYNLNLHNPINLEMDLSDGQIRIHFTDKDHRHIDGYFLMRTNKDYCDNEHELVLFESIGSNIKGLDVISGIRSLKVTGIDMHDF